MIRSSSDAEENTDTFRKMRLVIALVLLTVSLACINLVKRLTGVPEVTAVTTPVGTPNGRATTKSIGLAGGSLATPDGRLVLTIPQHALSVPVNITIQPITDQSPGGLGKAFRLEPNGQAFIDPVQISFITTIRTWRVPVLKPWT